MSEETLRKPPGWAEELQFEWTQLRASEWILAAFFAYVAVLSVSHRAGAGRIAVALLTPLAVVWFSGWAQRSGRLWADVARDWLPFGLMLIGYWELNWIAGRPMTELQARWVSWDRWLLDSVGLKALVESAGVWGASLLEFHYLFLYAVPPLCMLAVYRHGRRGRAERFLRFFLTGALSAYALLPHFPTQPPRLAYAGMDLPVLMTPLRAVNLWVLDHLDISTSVFPSGHVAVAFSAAFALWAVLPRQRWVAALVLWQASMVFVATIYGRYHYSADGLASILISGAAFLAVRWAETYD